MWVAVNKVVRLTMSHLRHEKQTYELRSLIFEVRKKLKAGWSEEVYHQALLQLFQDKDLPVQSKPRRAISHRGVQVHLFECDIIVRDLIILELKALPYTKLNSVHQAQLFHYLKCWGKDLGLLVNFGGTKADIQRLVWDEPKFEVEETYDLIKPHLNDTDREELRQIREVILNVGRQYGLGYPGIMYRQIIALELNYRGFICQSDVKVPVTWNGSSLREDGIDQLLVNQRHLLNVRALLDFPSSYEFGRTKNYLQHLGGRFGFVVNFGKKQLQIYGVRGD